MLRVDGEQSAPSFKELEHVLNSDAVDPGIENPSAAPF
jgi:hypothetical protein